MTLHPLTTEIVERPQQCEPAFYDPEGRPSKFFLPPRPYETEADLEDFWVLPENRRK